jgi:hypothetical protein
VSSSFKSVETVGNENDLPHFRSTVVFVIIDQETDDDCIADKVIFTTTRPADVQVIQNVPQIAS